ncbi:MAG: hypothetical protein KBC35_01715 [Candidatus Pacebacteria bacterium]|nr:hypothetical protein [Candidatus Paceibacterota bacterium]
MSFFCALLAAERFIKEDDMSWYVIAALIGLAFIFLLEWLLHQRGYGNCPKCGNPAVLKRTAGISPHVLHCPKCGITWSRGTDQ